jgi:cytochrome c-type biogenesis protein CcmF
VTDFIQPARSGVEATLQVDGKGELQPAIDTFDGTTQQVGTPAFTSSFIEDVYLAPVDVSAVAGKKFAEIQIVVQPLVSWLWIGGAVVAAGAVLAAIPGRRRRPTDPSTVPFPETIDDELVGQGVGR